MMSLDSLNTTYLKKCIDTLSLAHEKFLASNDDTIEKQLYRSACVKEFEIIIELSVKLMRKKLNEFIYDNETISRLNYKNVLRQASSYGIISIEHAEKWMTYRDLRNSTSHEYGENFAEDILPQIPQFIKIANNINDGIQNS